MNKPYRPLRAPRDPALASSDLPTGLKVNGFRSPEEHNASIRLRFGRRALPLDRDEVAALYGWDAALRMFPTP